MLNVDTRMLSILLAFLCQLKSSQQTAVVTHSSSQIFDMYDQQSTLALCK